MKRIILKGPDFCAVEEDRVLVEYLRIEETGQSGDILLGTVERIMPGLGCAFVNIGRKKAGFLPLQENSQTFSGPPLKSGMKIPVQIRKEEHDGKGAFLTRDPALAGKYILLMPLNRHIGVSSRILDGEEKERLRDMGRRAAEGRTGIVLRSAATAAEMGELAAETEELLQKWEAVLEGMKNVSESGAVLFHQDPVAQLISDYESRGIDEIRETDMIPQELEKQLREAENRRIPLRSGGNIVIDRCEAMTVIDVNTGSAAGGKGKDSPFLETNLEACRAAAAQIRLRNLAGIIVIDFIDMNTEQDRESVEKELQELLKADRRKTVIHGWTRLGLMEITRKRTGG